MRCVTTLAVTLFLSGATGVRGQEGGEVKRLREQVEALRAKLEVADKTIKKLQEENAGLRAASAKRFDLKGQFGTLAYAGTVTRTYTGKEYEYLIEELKLTFDSTDQTNSVDEIAVKEVVLSATRRPAEGGRATVLARDKKPTTLVLTKAAPTATLEKVKLVVTQDVHDQADHVGLSVTNGKLLWPIREELKAEVKK